MSLLKGPTIMRPTLEEVLADLELKVGRHCKNLWGLSKTPAEALDRIRPVLQDTGRKLNRQLGGEWEVKWIGYTHKRAVEIKEVK